MEIRKEIFFRNWNVTDSLIYFLEIKSNKVLIHQFRRNCFPELPFSKILFAPDLSNFHLL